jgi:hypothetical protein
VVREDQGAVAVSRMLLGSGGSATYHFHGGDNTIWHPQYTHPDVTNGGTWLNGLSVNGLTTARPKTLSVISVVTAGPLSADYLLSDPDNGAPWQGDVAEVVIYDRALAVSERLEVEDYLNRRHHLFVP